MRRFPIQRPNPVSREYPPRPTIGVFCSRQTHQASNDAIIYQAAQAHHHLSRRVRRWRMSKAMVLSQNTRDYLVRPKFRTFTL